MTTYNREEFAKLVRKVLKATQKTDAVVVGGLAVRHHGYDRITVDIDLLADREAFSTVCSHVMELGFFGDGEIRRKGKFEFTRMFHKVMGTPCDVILKNGLFSKVTSQPAIILSIKTKVIDLASLILMKKIAGREKDKNDLLFLEGE